MPYDYVEVISNFQFVFWYVFNCLTFTVQPTMKSFSSLFLFVSSSNILHMASKPSLYKESWVCARFAPLLNRLFLWTWTLSCIEKPAEAARFSKLGFLLVTMDFLNFCLLFSLIVFLVRFHTNNKRHFLAKKLVCNNKQPINLRFPPFNLSCLLKRMVLPLIVKAEKNFN